MIILVIVLYAITGKMENNNKKKTIHIINVQDLCMSKGRVS